MALYFLSDVHLRLDRPERGRRLARFVGTLTADDRLVIVGDLCDFWFASRQRRLWNHTCPGLESLAAFRARGGELTLLPGNHDAWLGRFYKRVLGVGLSGDSLELDQMGLRIRATHGHKVGARTTWKGVLESRAFLYAFSALPGAAARALEATLDSANDIRRDAINRKHVRILRSHADRLAGRADLCIFGHIHVVHDDKADPRLIVLGGWHARSSYLRIDGGTTELIVVEDEGGGT